MFGWSDEEKAAAKREAYREALRQRMKGKTTEYGGRVKSKAEQEAIDEEQAASKTQG